MRPTRALAQAGSWVLAAAMGCAPTASGQVTFKGHDFHVHGFFSQGFLYSSGNNYLTAATRDGSFRLTDGGLNVSSQLTNRVRVGAQVYARNIGHLGKGRLTMDWAFADCRINDWLGFRVGQVKTVHGLYNDTQDMEFLHTWALLPQSLYPIDLRGFSIRHLGGDLYGTFHVRRMGSLSYTAYAGKAPGDRNGGLQYGLASYGIRVKDRRGSMAGADLKWTPLTGVLLGAAYLRARQVTPGENLTFGGLFRSVAPMNTVTLAAQYSRGPWRVEWEQSRATSLSQVTTALSPVGPYSIEIPYDMRGVYVAGAYRISKRLELGAYHSKFYPNADRQIPAQGRYAPPAERHVHDQTITGRIDFNSHWDLKIEGHLIDGYGDAGTSRGFYPQDNPRGLQPRTNLLVIRLGFNR